MIEWVENILKPFIEMAPENVVPLLVLYPTTIPHDDISGEGNPTACVKGSTSLVDIC